VRKTVMIALSLMLSLSFGMAQEHGIGLGLAFHGADAGLTGKYWLGNKTAATATLTGHGLFGYYLIHGTDRFQYLDKIKTPYFYGVGIGFSQTEVLDEKETNLYIAGAIGQDYLFNKYPIDMYWKITPSINVTQDFDFDLFSFSWGIRYFF